METRAIYKTEISRPEEASLEELIKLWSEWVEQGRQQWFDLVMLVQALGKNYELRRHNVIAWTTGDCTAVYDRHEEKWDPARGRWIIHEILHISLGEPRLFQNEPIYREIVVCHLSRMDEEELDEPGTTFVPGWWLSRILTYLPEARDRINQARQAEREAERQRLANLLLIGREV